MKILRLQPLIMASKDLNVDRQNELTKQYLSVPSTIIRIALFHKMH